MTNENLNLVRSLLDHLALVRLERPLTAQERHTWRRGCELEESLLMEASVDSIDKVRSANR